MNEPTETQSIPERIHATIARIEEHLSFITADSQSKLLAAQTAQNNLANLEAKFHDFLSDIEKYVNEIAGNPS